MGSLGCTFSSSGICISHEMLFILLYLQVVKKTDTNSHPVRVLRLKVNTNSQPVRQQVLSAGGKGEEEVVKPETCSCCGKVYQAGLINQ